MASKIQIFYHTVILIFVITIQASEDENYKIKIIYSKIGESYTLKCDFCEDHYCRWFVDDNYDMKTVFIPQKLKGNLTENPYIVDGHHFNKIYYASANTSQTTDGAELKIISSCVYYLSEPIVAYRDNLLEQKQSYNEHSDSTLFLYCNFTGKRYDHQVHWFKDGENITSLLHNASGIFQDFQSDSNGGYFGPLFYSLRGQYKCDLNRVFYTHLEDSEIEYPVSFEFAVRTGRGISLPLLILVGEILLLAAIIYLTERHSKDDEFDGYLSSDDESDDRIYNQKEDKDPYEMEALLHTEQEDRNHVNNDGLKQRIAIKPNLETIPESDYSS